MQNGMLQLLLCPNDNRWQDAKWPYNIGIGSVRDTILSINIKVGGQVCAIEDCVSPRDIESGTYGNVNWALFCVVDRFWTNLAATKEVNNEDNA